MELDPVTGEAYLAEASRTGGKLEIRTSLPALGSRLFVIPKAKESIELPGASALVGEITETAWRHQQAKP